MKQTLFALLAVLHLLSCCAHAAQRTGEAGGFTLDAKRYLTCDGTTDDSNSLFAAIRELDSHGGGELILPKGQCLLKSGIAIPPNNHPYAIRGVSADETRLIWSSSSQIEVGLTLSHASHLAIYDVALVGDAQKPTISRAVVQCMHCSDVHFMRVRVSGGGWAEPKTGSLKSGVYIYDSTNLSFEDSELTGNGGGGQTSASSTDFVVDWDVGGSSSHIVFRNNRIHDSNTAASLSIYSTDNFEISQNRIDQNDKIGPDPKVGGYGIVAYQQARSRQRCGNGLVNENVVENTAGTGIYLQGCSNSKVVSNRLERVSQKQKDGTLAVSGISISAGYEIQPRSDSNLVDGNRVVSSGANGIGMANTDNVVVRNNRVEQAATSAMRLYNIEAHATFESNAMVLSRECLFVGKQALAITFEGNTCAPLQASFRTTRSDALQGTNSGNRFLLRPRGSFSGVKNQAPISAWEGDGNREVSSEGPQ